MSNLCKANLKIKSIHSSQIELFASFLEEKAKLIEYLCLVQRQPHPH